MTLDLSIGRGDNAPSPMWTLPFDPTGSDIVVVITMPGGSLLTLTSDGGDLVLDATARSVTWLVTTAQSALLPPTSFYTLRRVVPGGEVRYYAQGRIFGVDGPVGPANAVVTGAGPQGAPGPAATDAQIAAAVAAYIAANSTIHPFAFSANSPFPAVSTATPTVIVPPAATALAILSPAPSVSAAVLSLTTVGGVALAANSPAPANSNVVATISGQSSLAVTSPAPSISTVSASLANNLTATSAAPVPSGATMSVSGQAALATISPAASTSTAFLSSATAFATTSPAPANSNAALSVVAANALAIVSPPSAVSTAALTVTAPQGLVQTRKGRIAAAMAA